MSAAVRPVFTETQADAVHLAILELKEGYAGDRLAPSGRYRALCNAERQLLAAVRETERRKRGRR
jgi:hypothetical protein